MDEQSQPSIDTRLLECVEIYVPKKLEHLSELYTFLRQKMSDEGSVSEIDGFSLYEVDGAFRSDRVYQERTVVIRVMLPYAPNDSPQTVLDKIKELGREIATRVALGEQELWICHYQQHVHIFRPAKGTEWAV